MKMIRTKMDHHTRNDQVFSLLHISYMRDSTRSNKGIARSRPTKTRKKRKNSKCKLSRKVRVVLIHFKALVHSKSRAKSYNGVALLTEIMEVAI